MSHITACLNCSATIDNGPFCEQCGQRNVHVRLHFADLVRDVKDQLFEWDLPWLFTIREMALRPASRLSS